jgi:hypothetical protein
MLIFVEQISERLLYTFDFVFKNRDVDYQLTNDFLFFEDYQDFKWNYSNRYFEHCFSISPSDMLFDEKYIAYEVEKDYFFEIECLKFNGLSDAFASVFYVLSRMEEYDQSKLDVHNRFQAKNSVLIQYNWVKTSICDRWSEGILALLEEKIGISFTIQYRKTQFIPSFDIDHVRAFEWKNFWRRTASAVKDRLKGDALRVQSRKLVLNGKMKDPYDTFDIIKKTATEFPETRVFWLLGNYGKYDKNVPAHDIRHQRLIKIMSKFAHIGLHPSYNSNNNSFSIQREKKRLDTILQTEIKESRQHFLKVNFPITYQILDALEFTDDYTMGFASTYGFRCGTAQPIAFFDLEHNKRTSYILHPFVYMDGTLHEYMNLSIAESKQVIEELYRECVRYGGDFCFIWHNETISNFGKWKGWSEVFEFTLNLHRN